MCLTRVAEMLPGYITPRYELLKLYRETGDKDKVAEVARIMTALPLKKDTNETDAMRAEARLEIALHDAGENRNELECVLEHYKDDNRKLKVARFLIENMIDVIGADMSVVDACEPFYSQYDSLMLTHGRDSLLRIFDYSKICWCA